MELTQITVFLFVFFWGGREGGSIQFRYIALIENLLIIIFLPKREEPSLFGNVLWISGFPCLVILCVLVTNCSCKLPLCVILILVWLGDL